MPLMYVMDSIMKNVTTKYIALFGSQMEQLVPEIFPSLNAQDQTRLRHLVASWRTMGTFTPRYVGVIEQSILARTRPPPPSSQFIRAQNLQRPPQQQDDAYLREILVQLQPNKPMSARMSLEQARLPRNRNFYNYLLQYAAAHRNRNPPPPMVQHQRPPPHMNVVSQQYASHQMQPSYPETKTTSSDVLINRLYGGHQDLTTGLRFPSEKDPRYATHLDLQFKRRQHLEKIKADGIMSSRSWFCNAKEWDTLSLIELREIEQKTAYSSFEDPTTKEEEEDDKDTPPGVPADEKQTVCPICQVPFERIKWTSADGFDTVWLYDKTMYSPDGSRKILHVECYRESLNNEEKVGSRKRALSGDENGTTNSKKRAKLEEDDE
eukprot:g792.t1